MPDIGILLKQMILEHLDSFKIELYQNEFQNQVMSLGIRSLTEDMDEENREHDLKYLSETFKDNLYERWSQDNYRSWVLRNSKTIYGYVAIKIDDNEATLKGIYLEPLLRGTGLSTKMLKQVIKFCRDQGCIKLKADVAHYSLSGLRFYEKNGFVRNKTELENNDRLRVLYYHLDLTPPLISD